MELTKDMLEHVVIDNEYEPYGYMDQQYVNYPSTFPCVRLKLVDTDVFCKMIDEERIKDGEKPFFAEHKNSQDLYPDGYYDLFVEINGYSKTSNAIEVNVISGDTGDSIEAEYLIDIPDDLRDALYIRLSEQIDCDGLLKECEANNNY